VAAGLSTTEFGAQGRLPAANEVLAEQLPSVTALHAPEPRLDAKP
jgi:hypothetical protein